MTAAGTLRAMTGSPLNTTNCHLYHYAGNNPVRYVDPDGWCAFGTNPDDINYFMSIAFSEVIRSCVGADYSHLRMPTSSKMDCSGMLIYALDKMGYEVPSDVTADNIAKRKYSWIKVLDKVDNSRQGEPGMLNLYYFDESYISHVNYGVGRHEDEIENQVADASTEGTSWQQARNKNERQNTKAVAGKVNITWAPFSTNSVPDFQAIIDFTKLKRKKLDD